MELSSFNKEHKYSVNIEFTSHEACQFFILYECLGPIQKKIFHYLQRFCKNSTLVYPRQSVIAKEVECSREYVNRTIKKFVLYKWLTSIRRGKRTSNLYYIDHKLLDLDILNRCSYYRQNVEITSPITPTFLNPNPNPRTSLYTGSISPKSQENHHKSKVVEIPGYINAFNIPLEDKIILSVCGKDITNYAIDRAKADKRLGKQIDDVPRYIVGIAKNQAKSQGINIWPSYHETFRYYQRKT